MGAQGKFPSDSQRDLAKSLTLDGDTIRERLDGKVHRTVVWKYATAARRPGPNAIALIEDATRDLQVPVLARGWGRSRGKVLGASRAKAA